MTTIKLSETAEILLKRIMDSRFGLGVKSSMMYDSMIEHLTHEEARRLNVIEDMKEEKK